MPTFDIVCLANARKRQGRTLAGLRTDGKGWLRPIGPNAEGVLLPHHYMLPDDTEPQPLDVLRIQCSRPQPKPHHPEDWIVMPLAWQRVANVSESAQRNRLDWLRGQLSSGPNLLGSNTDRIAYAELEARPATQSLALVAPETLQWQLVTNKEGARQTRVIFALAGAEYNLVLTDPVWEQRMRSLSPGTHPRHAGDIAEDAEVWLTISLGEPLAAAEGSREFCYKRVMGVMVLAKAVRTARGTGQDKVGGKEVKEIEEVKVARSARRAAPKVTVLPYTGNPDALAYPAPFADDIEVVAVTEGRLTVTASVIQPEMLAVSVPAPPEINPTTPNSAAHISQDAERSHDTRQKPLDAPLSAVTTKPPERPNAQLPTVNARHRAASERKNFPDAQSVQDSKSGAKANGKWDTPQDQVLWRQQLARTRQSLAVLPIPWSEEEDALLRRLAADGETPADMASQLGRPVKTIYTRLETFGLIEPGKS